MLRPRSLAGMLALALLTAGAAEVSAQPVISQVSPNAVTYGITPDTSVTISGTGFQLGATITVGSLSGTTVSGTIASATTPFVYVSPNVLRFWWDNLSLAPGAYDVVVTNPDSTTVTAPGAFVVNAPQPTVSSTSPNPVTYGVSVSQSITISGTNFVLGATITVGSLSGTTVQGSVATASTPFVWVSNTTVRFWWPNTSLGPGSYTVQVTNPAAAGGLAGSLAAGFTVNAPQPTVTGTAPNPVTYGISPSQSITITGTNFVLGATITVGSLTGTTVAGSVATATTPYVWVSNTTVRFWWPNTALAPGSYTVQVTNPSAAGGLAGSLAAGFTVNAPQPAVTSAVPSPVTYGISASQSITISGTNFVSGATITVGSLSGTTVAGSVATASQPFVFVSSSTVRFWWPNTSLAPGSYDVVVTNPASAGGMTGTLSAGFTVSGSQPTVSSVTPPQVTYAGTSMAITVAGSGFLEGATVALSGPTPDTTVRLSGTTVAGSIATASQPFVFVSATRLSFFWNSTALPLGRYTVRVTNPAGSGGLVATLADAFEVVAAIPTISGTSPSQVTYDIMLSRAITIVGTNFVEGATILINSPSTSTCLPSTCSLSGPTVAGTAATASTPFVFIRSTQLSFYWPNTSLTPGSYSVIVRNPDVAGGTQVTLDNAFTVAGPQPVISTITPSSVEYNLTASTSVRITGSNFYGPSGSDRPSVTVGTLTLPCVSGTGPADEGTPCVHIDRRNIEFFWKKTATASDPLYLAPGVYAVRVTNPAYAGAVSSDPAQFTVRAPRPQIESIRPLAVTAGITAPRVVDIVGTDNAAQDLGFVANATVTLQDPATTASTTLVCGAGTTPTVGTRCVFVSAGLLRFYWDTALLGVGSYNVTVTNPATRGGLASLQPGRFRVTALPELISVEPAAVGSGARSAVLTLTTAGFGAGATVRIGTVNTATPPYVETQDPQVTMRSAFRTFASGDGGTIVIDVAEDRVQAADRNLAVTMTSVDGLYRFTCPDSAAADTCKSGLTITPPPAVTAITPALGVGTSGGTLTIAGLRFMAGGTTVTLPTGVSGTCTAASATAITCTNVAVAASVLPGRYSVVVTNPDGGRWTGLLEETDPALTINAPPVISSVSPNFGAAGSSVSVRVTGSGFQAGVVLTLDSGITATNVTRVDAGTVDAVLVIASGAAVGYRSLTVTNPDRGVAIAPQAFYIGTLPTDDAQAVATFGAQGQALVQYQRSLGAAWASRINGPAVSSPPVWQVMKASPIRDERLLAVVDDQRRVTLHVWNGQTWIGAIEAATASGLARPTQTVDVAFEQQSGRGLAVYAGADTTLRYRVWDGSSWGNEALVEDPVNGQPTSGRPLWVRLEARPGTNDLVLAYQDSNDDVAAFVWNGTTQQWGDAVLLTGSAPGHGAPLVDVAFERLTGRALVVWATTAPPAGRPRYRVWNSGWGVESTTQLGAGSDSATLTALRLVGDLTSDRTALATTDGASLLVQTWDGQQWASTTGGAALTTELLAEARGRAFDLAWEGVSGGDLLAVYVPRSASGGVWRTWSASSGWSTASALPAPASITTLTTTLSRAAGSTDTGLSLTGTPDFPEAGLVSIDSELIRYTSKNASSGGTTLAGLTRGEFGTTAATHASGATVQVVAVPAWLDLAASRGIAELALASFDTQGRALLRRWTGAAWTASVEAQADASGLVSVFDPALARNTVVAGRALAVTLAHHLRGPEPGITPPPVVADTTPPATPVLTAGTPGVTSVGLSWTAVGDDGMSGSVSRYELRRSSVSSSTVQNVTPTQAPGGTETLTVSSLSSGTSSTFDVRAIDDAGNASSWSNAVTITTAVDQAPPAVSLALASAPSPSSITIQWTVPSDDSGPIAGYQVRYAVGTSFNFDTATPYTAHLPTVVNSTATLAIDGLLANTLYAIGVKAVDAAGQVSPLSNVLTATTAAGSSTDVTPPAAVSDLSVFAGATTSNSVLLTWTATGDDGTAGTAASYEVRYAAFPLTAGNFAQGTPVAPIPPGPSGTAQELVVTGLASNTTYYLALLVRDDSGNASALSNVVTARTALRRGYTMVSVPLVLASPNDTPDAVFGDDVGLPPYAYRWDSAGPGVSDGCYVGTVSQPAFQTCGSLSVIRNGLAYFLYSAGNRAVLNATGSAVSEPTVEVPLEEGFNMIGNPYGQEIPLSAVQVRRTSDPTAVSYAEAVTRGWVAAAMYLYDGAVNQPLTPGDPGAVFKPWNGAWIQSRVSDAVLVFPQP